MEAYNELAEGIHGDHDSQEHAISTLIYKELGLGIHQGYSIKTLYEDERCRDAFIKVLKEKAGEDEKEAEQQETTE